MSKTGEAYVDSTRRRTLDLAVASALSVFLVPADLAIMAVVMKEHKTFNPIYKNKRPGKDGNLITVPKFKTVETTNDPEERQDIWPGSYHPDAPPASLWLRRKGLDEIPQLLAVILGSMGMVGNRPLPQSTRDYWQSVTPQEPFSEWDEISQKYVGVTGVEQLYGKQHDVTDPNLEESPAIIRRRVELGTQSFYNASLKNDIRILAATPLVLMFPDQASLPRVELAPEAT